MARLFDAARPERWILGSVLGLCAFGLVMVYSAGSVWGLARANASSAHYLIQQLPKLGIGLVLLAVFSFIDYRRLGERRAFGAMLFVLGALLMLVILGKFRWFRVAGMTVQPSEFARVALVVYLASALARGEEAEQMQPRDLILPALIAAGAAGLVVLQPSLSMGVLLFAVAACIFYLAGVRKRYIVLATGVLAALALLTMRAYQWSRISDILGGGTAESSWQRLQSITAVGSGGLWGLGLGNGLQKYFFLPFPHTDFILGIVGEETGLLGATVLLLGYAILIYAGISVARRTTDPFGSLLAAGITLNLALNIVVHGVVNLGLGPVTGVPLPFMSAGGSSLIANLLAMGILISVARRSVRARMRDWSSMRRSTP